jgi:hypothetical protein
MGRNAYVRIVLAEKYGENPADSLAVFRSFLRRFSSDTSLSNFPQHVHFDRCEGDKLQEVMEASVALNRQQVSPFCIPDIITSRCYCSHGALYEAYTCGQALILIEPYIPWSRSFCICIA